MKMHYYSANVPPNERGPTSIAETYTASVDTTPNVNDRAKSNRDESSETVTGEQCDTTAQLPEKNMSERSPHAHT